MYKTQELIDGDFITKWYNKLIEDLKGIYSDEIIKSIENGAEERRETKEVEKAEEGTRI